MPPVKSGTPRRPIESIKNTPKNTALYPLFNFSAGCLKIKNAQKIPHFMMPGICAKRL